MTGRPASPPGYFEPEVTPEQRAAIEKRLGVLPDDLLHAVRDGRGHTFQRLEFLGDAVLELVIRFHADISAIEHGAPHVDPDSLVTDAALAVTADQVGLADWLEWEASAARRADLVEACAGAVWVAHGWEGLARFVDEVVHPLAPLTAGNIAHGWPDPITEEARRGREVLGASVLEVAAASLAYRTHPEAHEGDLTAERNHAYATHRVVTHAIAAGWDTGSPKQHENERRDVVERRLADIALGEGLAAAVAAATALLTPAVD